MPLFEYTCGDCGMTDEYLVSGNQRPLCYYCGSDKLVKEVVQGFNIGGSSNQEYEVLEKDARERAEQVARSLPEKWEAGNRIIFKHKDGRVSRGKFIRDDLGVVVLGTKRAGQNE